MVDQANPFSNLITELDVAGKKYKYFSLKKLNDPRVGIFILNF